MDVIGFPKRCRFQIKIHIIDYFTKNFLFTNKGVFPEKVPFSRITQIIETLEFPNNLKFRITSGTLEPYGIFSEGLSKSQKSLSKLKEMLEEMVLS